MPDDSVVALLHLAQAAAQYGEWDDVVMNSADTVYVSTEDTAFVRAASPSVVVALLERLQQAEAQVVLFAANLDEACDAFEECTGDYAKELCADDITSWREMAADALGRGVTGLQEPGRAALGDTPEQPKETS